VAGLSRDQLRILDANANRAREGIRTAEDYIRLALMHPRWSQRLKGIRHALTDALREYQDELLKTRNVASDPGRAMLSDEGPAAATESAKCVALRGIKRAQEALRVIEENLRGATPAVGNRMGAFRFELYDAEQWLVLTGDSARILNSTLVYVLVTECMCTQGLIRTVEAVLKGGARLLQLREKNQVDGLFLAQAQQLREVCGKFGAVLICNDRVDLALLANASGVHVGQEDLCPADARKLCGERLLIGRSTHSVEQARQAVEQEQADYIAIGSIYETSTKQGRTLAGLKLAEQVCELKLETPVFAIGGITLERIAELKAVGIKRVAVSSAIILDRDPERATGRMIEALAN